ncbi:MAG: TonB family protein [Nitrospira sp.]|nr:TonB family protein [Nitrospira sp.]
MRGPSLQKATIISFALHLTVFLAAILILRHSSRMVMPAPYTVSLVSPDVIKGVDKGADIDKGRDENVVRETKESHAPSASAKKSKKEIDREKEMLEKKISALAAKKKIEKIVKLRSVISLKASGDKRSLNEKAVSPSAGKYTQSDNYYSTIMEEIQPYWSLPPGMANKGLEATVSIRILKDGTVIVLGMEKKSGNALFDKAARRAPEKASPLTPPPYEMEIGVRFYP